MSLWKHCFYKAIEEYRTRIRQVHAFPLSFFDTLKTAQTLAKSPGSRPKEELQKICRSFRGYLESSTEFYHQLVHKLKTYYNLDLDHPFSEKSMSFLILFSPLQALLVLGMEICSLAQGLSLFLKTRSFHTSYLCFSQVIQTTHSINSTHLVIGALLYSVIWPVITGT